MNEGLWKRPLVGAGYGFAAAGLLAPKRLATLVDTKEVGDELAAAAAMFATDAALALLGRPVRRPPGALAGPSLGSRRRSALGTLAASGVAEA